MGYFLVFERFVWFDAQVRQKRFPNAVKLAKHFELSRKTAQRNIDFMRDRLFAPLEYDPSKKGYFYIDETFDPKPADQWQHLLEGAFGIFQAKETVQVVLRFTSFRARWIKEQIWYPNQTMTRLENGSLELSFPVADFWEIKLKILQFGADVEVISPEELRREIQKQ